MKTACAVALWAWILAAAPAHAQAAAEPVTAPPQAAAGTPAPEAPSAPDSAGAQEPAKAPASAAKSPESFVPSEEISEDLSVSFPVDI
jgi:hypothetical protein